MNNNGKWRARLRAIAILAMALIAGRADAFNYTNSDLILVFHLDTSRNDVEFNLGPASNFVSMASGTTITITNWDRRVVLNNYDNDLNGVLFTIVGATAVNDPQRRIWLTVSSAGTPSDMAGSPWTTLWSKVDGFGQQAAVNSYYAPENFYVVSPNSVSSFSYMASDGYTTPISTIGGRTPATVENSLTRVTIEGVVPANLRFFAFKATNVNPKPAAQQVGTFALSANGVLTFTAGAEAVVNPPPKPQITGTRYQNGTATVSFTTTNAVSYRLVYSTDLRNSMTNWTPVGASVTGNGSVMSLTDTTASGYRFYGVQATR